MTLNSLGLTSRLEWYYEHSNSLPKSWDIYVSNVIPGGLLSLSETKIHEIVYGSDYGRSGITFDTLGDESRQLLENIKGGPIPNLDSASLLKPSIHTAVIPQMRPSAAALQVLTASGMKRKHAYSQEGSSPISDHLMNKKSRM